MFERAQIGPYVVKMICYIEVGINGFIVDNVLAIDLVL